MVVGKLKPFAFLDTDSDKPRRKMNLDNVARGDFCGSDLDGFYEQLRHALDNFVVRWEIVVSDLQTFYTATTSVTFTKTTCFRFQGNEHAH